MNIIYFQPPNIDPRYCEVGTYRDNDPDYIYYLYEPCKILATEVEIVPKDRVSYDKKTGLYVVS